MRLIYHYCSMETFNIIMRNKTLRLSDITKSNDSQEKVWIYNNLQDALKCAFQSMHLSLGPEDSNKEDSYFLTLKSILDEVVHQESLVVCFSKAEDLLSQWRGYANDGCGFAIGFDQILLERYLSRDDRFSLDNIEYDKEKQIERLKSDIVRTFFDEITGIGYLPERVPSEKGIEYDFSPYQDYFYEEFDDISYEMEKYFDFSSCFMKNSAFREENEVRIVFASQFGFNVQEGYEINTKIKGTTKLTLGKIDYQVKGSKLVPYVDMNFSNAVKDGIIKKIVIGPKADVSEDELERYLWYLGFDGIEIKKSSASYV